MKILDLGCAGWRYPGSTGVDIDKQWKPDVLWDLNKTPYPFKDSSYDMIVSREVLEHLSNLDGFIKEIKRILTPNGMLLLTTNNRGSLVNRLFHSYEIKGEGGHISLQTIKSLKEIVSKELTIIDCYCLPYAKQRRTDMKYKILRVFRIIAHRLLPQSMQERIVIIAMKTDAKDKLNGIQGI